MFILIGVLFVLIGIILIWFHVPYSPVKRDFQNDIGALMSENQLHTNNEVFTEEDFSSLPVVNVNIKMIKKWKIKMYIFQDLFLSLCFHKGSFFF